MTKLLLLNYHGIESRAGEYPWQGGEAVYVTRLADFEAGLESIRRQGFATLSLDGLMHWLSEPRKAKAVMLTFDDGHASHHAYAAPALAQRGMKAVFFVSTSLAGIRPFMSWQEIKELRALGFEIGSHGHLHEPMAGWPYERIKSDLTQSKKMLEDRLGCSVRSFSIPRGFYRSKIEEAARESGFEFMFTSQFGLNGPGQNPLCLKRVAVTAGTQPGEIEGWLNGRLGHKLITEKAKEMVRNLVPAKLYEGLSHFTRHD